MADAPPKKVCIPVDDSQHSARALEWAVKNIIRPSDKLSLLCVRNILTDPFAAEAVATPLPEGYEDTKQAQEGHAQCSKILDDFSKAAAKFGVNQRNILTTQVPPEGGASGVGESIVQFVESTQQDLVVLGSRGMGSIKRAMMGMLGLGSVSDFTVNHVHCPVIVVKPPKT